MSGVGRTELAPDNRAGSLLSPVRGAGGLPERGGARGPRTRERRPASPRPRAIRSGAQRARTRETPRSMRAMRLTPTVADKKTKLARRFTGLDRPMLAPLGLRTLPTFLRCRCHWSAAAAAASQCDTGARLSGPSCGASSTPCRCPWLGDLNLNFEFKIAPDHTCGVPPLSLAARATGSVVTRVAPRRAQRGGPAPVRGPPAPLFRPHRRAHTRERASESGRKATPAPLTAPASGSTTPPGHCSVLQEPGG